MYTRDFVKNLLISMDNDSISKMYTKSNLLSMHVAVYGWGSSCPSGWRKEDIIRSMRRYFDGIARAQALKP